MPAKQFEHGAEAPAIAIAINPALLSPTTPAPGLDLSEYGIDIINLRYPPIAQVNNNGARVFHVDECHRQNSSHYSHHGHTCESDPMQSYTQHTPQQAMHRESNMGRGQERVVLVYLQSTNQAS